MSSEGFETLGEISLKHLPNDAKLVLQRQQSDIIGENIQFGLPSTFVNPDNNQTVWIKGPSIQLQQIPELVEMLTEAYKKYSGEEITTETKTEKTYTFADYAESQ